MALRWFAVKSVYRAVAVGKPKTKNKGYREDATLVEERIVLFRAKDGRAALEKGEKEAKSYAKTTHTNPFGQKIKTHFLGDLDVFELFNPPAEGMEVFSATEIVSSKTKDKGVLEAKFGKEPPVPVNRDSVRIKFLSKEFWQALEKR